MYSGGGEGGYLPFNQVTENSPFYMGNLFRSLYKNQHSNNYENVAYTQEEAVKNGIMPSIACRHCN